MKVSIGIIIHLITSSYSRYYLGENNTVYMFCYLCFCQKVSMFTKNMFQISSLLSNNNNNNDINSKTSDFKRYGYKNPYKVLTVIPKWAIFCFYLRSILIGLWVIVKWTFQFLWSSLSQVHWCSHRNKCIAAGDYYGGLHDKPPPCLVDTRLGLQSYVKLKVRFVRNRTSSKLFINVQLL